MAASLSNQPSSYGARVWRRFWRQRVGPVSLVILIFLYLFSFVGPLIYNVDSTSLNFAKQFAGPSLENPLGNDEVGRDVLIRLMEGGQVSLAVGTFAVLVAVLIGVVLGALAGYYLRWVDNLLMRLTDGFMAVPTFFIVLCALTFFGPSLTNIILVIGFTSWMGLARLVRGEILAVRQEIYVEAARALGAQDFRIIFRHILPQVTPTIIVNASFGIAGAILLESAISFLGVGVQPPAASWGNMLTNSQNYLYNAPWLALYPGGMILITVLAFNALGDALRDASDPASMR